MYRVMTCPHIKSGMRCKICEPPPEKKKPKPIKKKGKKLEERLETYKVLRVKFLKEHPCCEVENCYKFAEHVHHKSGRENELLNDVSLFMAVCPECHRKIHDFPDWALTKGYRILRTV